MQYKNWEGNIDRLNNLIDKDIKEEILGDIKIYLSCKKEYLFPKLRALIYKLEKAGAKITEPPSVEYQNNNLGRMTKFLTEGKSAILQENDNSLEIWHFEQEKDAVIYLANYVSLNKNGSENAFEAWIDDDNKKFDNALHLLNLPVSGCEMKNTIPVIPQLFLSALSLFQYPLNLTHLTNYLSFVFHPLGNKFAHKLAMQIIKTGGLYLEDTPFAENPFTKIISDFIHEDENNKQCYECLLREQITQQSNKINKDKILKVTDKLLSYTEEHFKQNINEIQRKQFEFLRDILKAFRILANNEHSDDIEFPLLKNWITNLYVEQNHILTTPKVNAPNIVHSAGELPVTDKTVWISFYNYKIQKSIFSFLTDCEKTILTQTHNIDLWKTEFNYYKHLMLTPFVNTSKKLVLILCDKRGDELIAKNPVYLRMINIEKSLNEKDYKNHFSNCIVKDIVTERGDTSVEYISNFVPAKKYITFKNDKLQDLWPANISATALETLIQYPLDFVLDNIALFRQDSYASMPLTYGTVFHLMVESLFKKGVPADNIKDTINDTKKFDDLFDKCIRYKGLLLYLPENGMELIIYKEQLRNSLLKLADYLKENNLNVESCEAHFSDKIFKDDSYLNGRIDMLVLTNEYISGLDFKWSKHPAKYNRKPIQLELYKILLEKSAQDKITEPFKYYIFPDGIIPKLDTEFLKNQINGKIDIFDRIKNSYIYRKNEFLNGIVENSEGEILSNIEYYTQTENKNLYPLEERKSEHGEIPNGYRKQEKIYSDYKCFKKELL